MVQLQLVPLACQVIHQHLQQRRLPMQPAAACMRAACCRQLCHTPAQHSKCNKKNSRQSGTHKATHARCAATCTKTHMSGKLTSSCCSQAAIKRKMLNDLVAAINTMFVPRAYRHALDNALLLVRDG
jgi:hypothetical protein